MRIIQIVESLAIGDAVANDAVALDMLLRKMNFGGGIYVTNENNIHKSYLHHIAEPVRLLPRLEESDIVLFHHAIANDFCYKLAELFCHKILVYHNITPPHFFSGIHEGFQNATKKGLDQLQEMNSEFDFCIADSEFNKLDLVKAGYSCPIFVCPVLVPFKDYDKEPNSKVIEKYSDGKKNILFVGRLSPNKKQEDIIHTFAIYKKYYNTDARLFLVGSDGVEQYAKSLRHYVKQLNLEDVYITGSVPFGDILAYYAISDLFVCMSEHEGFCVPLLEAMYFKVPILAYESSAIPYTLGEAGVLLKNKDFQLAAGWVDCLINDTELRRKIIQEQSQRLEIYSYENVSTQMECLLKNVVKILDIEDRQPIDMDALQQTVSYDEHSFVLVMPIKASDWEIAKRGLKYIWENLKPRKIVIISSSILKKTLRNERDVVFIDENKLVPGMTFSKVKETIEKAGGDGRFTGWLLQQFIKLGFSRICKDRYYLVWDADTLPLTPISFFDEISGKPLFNLKREYVKAYFDTMEKLLKISKGRSESYITEHMMFDVEMVQEMLDFIEKNDNIAGESFWEKCIYACEFPKYQQAFSEYETYGTYVMSKHPESYGIRLLKTFRCGTDFLGENPSDETLQWVAKEFDTISFEHWSTPLEESVKLCNDSLIRAQIRFAEIVDYICKKIRIKAITGDNHDREAEKNMRLKMEFDYFFGDDPVYVEKQSRAQ